MSVKLTFPPPFYASLPLSYPSWETQAKKSGRGREEEREESGLLSLFRHPFEQPPMFGGGQGRKAEEGGGVEEQEVREGEERKGFVSPERRGEKRSAYSIARCLSALSEERSKRGATNFLCLLPPPLLFHLFPFR